MSDFAARGSMLGDFAQQQRTQCAMTKEANYIIIQGTAPAERKQLAGKILRDPVGWAAVVYAHVVSVDPGVPTSSMDDATLTAAVGNAITDLAATENVGPA